MLYVSSEEADSGGRHQHYMTQPKGRLQKGMRHRTDIPSGGPPSSGLDAGMTPAASIRRSTTMPQRWCFRHGTVSHGILRKALLSLSRCKASAHAICNMQDSRQLSAWRKHKFLRSPRRV